MTIHAKPSAFRPDVEGLRAIAVLMVLIYHLDGHWLGGGFAGVDVFFVISGFLITGLLARQIDKTGTVSLVDFYARRAKRLFPAAALVLASTAAASWWLMPSTRWQSIGGDITAAAGYFINWRLAARSVDYLAEDVAPSPVQHFWSLAVEEQYYIVWPLLLVALIWLVGRWLKGRPLLLGVTVLVGIPSFIYSIVHTSSSPTTAYFITTTRMWELAIGATVALTAAFWTRLPAKAAAVLGWLGLALIVASSLVISRKTAWPGYAALAPTLGTAAVIAAGFAAGRKGPLSVLGTWPMVWIGGLSYSLYLWHWPLVQLAKAHWGNDLTPLVTAGVAIASIALAWLTLHLVENPIRESKRMHENPRYALSTGLNFTLIGIIAGLCLMLASTWSSANSSSAVPAAQTRTLSSPIGARALAANSGPDDPALKPIDSFPTIIPRPEQATLDVPAAYTIGCQLPFDQSEPRTDCYYGRSDGTFTIALAGDSKAVQWLPALELLAQKYNFRIMVQAKSACGFHDRPLELRDGSPYTSCTDWNKAALTLILGANKPQVVFTPMGAGETRVNQTEVDALKKRWTELTDSGIAVIAMANNPGPPINVYECVAQNPDHLSKCAFPRRNASATASMRVAAEQVPNVHYVDLNDSICGTSICPAVVGGVLIYRQGSHITKTYAESLAPRLEQQLVSAGILKQSEQNKNAPLEIPANGANQALRSPPFGIDLEFPHITAQDRVLVDSKGKKQRRIRFGYTDNTREQVLDLLTRQFAAQGLYPGKRLDLDKSFIRQNFSSTDRRRRIVVQIEPIQLDGSGLGGQVYMSQPLEEASVQ